ncbi:apolipoprotein N-acyltransferase [Brevundimonas sp. A19_0]|uniref:apolipoprotein N-acyltransferase n=1 Tax=Brevundimonas sp. A19_0 TaxID=2821087 RepID=UPI001FD835A3|nr:apolipoprotein N-acyltransferase [Brevundimonas sp. A19_0]
MTDPVADPRPRLGGRMRLLRLALALIAGAGAALAHPPFGILPGLFGYALLLVLADGSPTRRSAFWMGWLAGFAYFMIGCWWVAEAFLVNPDQAWMAPFAAALLPSGMGLFWGLALLAYRHLRIEGVRRVLAFAALFALGEWLRGHVLTGFPWNPAGASWQAGSAGSQAASLIGVYGLGLLTVAGFAAVGPLLAAGNRKARAGAAVLGLALILALNVWGGFRLAGARVEMTPTVIRIVQADVDQQSKWTPEAYRSIVERYINLTGRPGARVPDVVVWPEGALPNTANAVLAPDGWEAAALRTVLQPGQVLLMGMSRAEPDPSSEVGARFYNSLLAVRRGGERGLEVTGLYDKYRLVPFGEYLPAGPLMSRIGLRSLVHVGADFSAGPRPAPLKLEGLPDLQPLICYESLYPGFTRGAGADRPLWIANVSNDAWFGRTSGPVQHLNLAAYRAIETGLPVVRATPTGISALIDPFGRVDEGARLDPGESGVIDTRLPAALSPTLYGRVGDLIFWVLTLSALLVALADRLRPLVSRLGR